MSETNAAQVGVDDAALAREGRYRRLLAINAEAFDAGDYEVAYHALCAALHSAFGLHDGGLLVAVRTRAQDHGGHIDRTAPDHPLSSSSAHRRGTQAVYTSLAHQATTMAGMVRADTLHHHPPE